MFKKINLLTTILCIILAVYSISLLIPLSWGIITSLKSRSDFVINIFGLPSKWCFLNYLNAFSKFSVIVKYGLTTRAVNLGEMLIYSVYIQQVL